MKNNFLRKGLITGAVLTGWLVFTSLSGSASAADAVVGGDTTPTVAANVVTISGTQLDQVNDGDSNTITVNETAKITVDGAIDTTYGTNSGDTGKVSTVVNVVASATDGSAVTLTLDNTNAGDTFKVTGVNVGAKNTLALAESGASFTSNGYSLGDVTLGNESKITNSVGSNFANMSSLSVGAVDTTAVATIDSGAGTNAVLGVGSVAVADGSTLKLDNSGTSNTVNVTGAVSVAGTLEVASGATVATDSSGASAVSAVNIENMTLSGGKYVIANVYSDGGDTSGSATTIKNMNITADSTFDNQVAYDGTVDPIVTPVATITNLTIDAATAGGSVTGLFDNSAGTSSKTSIATATLTGDATNTATMNIENSANVGDNNVAIATLNMNGKSKLDIDETAATTTVTVAQMNVNSGAEAVVDVIAGAVDTTTIDNVKLSGKLTTATAAPTINTVVVDGTGEIVAGVATEITNQVTDTATTDTLTVDGTAAALTLAGGANLKGDLSVKGTNALDADAVVTANNITVGSGAGIATSENVTANGDLTLSGGKITLASGKTLDVKGGIKTLAASELDTASGTGTVTIGNKSSLYSDLKIGETGKTDVGFACIDLYDGATLTIADGADSAVTTSGTVTTKYVDGSGAAISSAAADETFTANSTVVSQNTKLTVTSAQDNDINLGSLTLSGGELVLASATSDIGVSSFKTDTDIGFLTSGAASEVDLATGSKLYLDKDLIYNSTQADIKINNVSATQADVVGAGKLLDTSASGTLAADGIVKESEVLAQAEILNNDIQVSNGATLVIRDAVNGSGTTTVGSGTNLVAMDAFTRSGDVTVDGAMDFKAAGNIIGTLKTTGTTGVIKGNKVTVDAAEIDSNEKLTVAGSMALTATTSADAVNGTIELAGNSGSEGTLDINNNDVKLGDDGSANATGKLNVAAGKVGTIVDTTGGHKITTAGGDIYGHLTLGNGTNGVELVVDGGTLAISANTLAMTNASSMTITKDGALGGIAGAETGHITVTANGAANTATINNQSEVASNNIGDLDITSKTANDATMAIDNNSANAAVLKIVDATLSAENAGGDAILSINASAAGNHDVTINKLTLDGVSAVTDAKLSVLDTGAGTTNVTVDLLEVSDSKFGTVSTTALAGTTNVIVANVGNGATLDLDGDAAGKLVVDTLNLNGTTFATAAKLDAIAGATTVKTVNVDAGKFGNVTDLANLTVNHLVANGALAVGAGATTWTMAADDTVFVGSKGVLTIALGDKIDATAAGTKVTVNLGSNTGFQADVNGAVDVSETTAGTIDNLYAENGVSKVTYTDVFDGLLTNGAAITNDEVLQTTDAYRTYTLTAGTVATSSSVVVSTNVSGIRNAVVGNGGTATASTAATYLIENQGSMNTEGFNYVDGMSKLGGADFARAAEQTIGEEGTTATAQAGVMSVQNSAKSVSNQMTSFRSGNIGAAMTSSFNSGGATSALSNMADADTLADAYEAGFTSASDCGVYKKVQVWANGFGGFGEQGSDGNMIGYDFWNIGTMVGLDYAFAKELRVGALLGYSYNKTDGYWGSGDSSDNAIRFGAYASYNWDNFFVDMSPTMGVHMIDSNRNIWNGATAKGERTGIDFNMNGTIGYTFNLPAAIQITPTYSLSYTMFYDPDYTETGAGAANLAVDSFTSNSLIQDLGVKVGKLFRSSEKLAFLPEVWGGWEVEYLNTGGSRNSTTSSSIGGQAYSTTMNGMSTHRGYWGAGMTALIGDDVSVYGRYDHKIWDKGYNVGFSAGVKVSF